MSPSNSPPEISVSAESPVQAGLAFGANLGDAQATIERALRTIAERKVGCLQALSSFWSTPPWGLTEQPDFVNACAIVTTQLSPHALLDAVKQIERDLGRMPSVRWGPRALDIDILFYGDLALHHDHLELPHPRMFERAFVLAPLAEIAPAMTIGGRSISGALTQVDQTGLRRLPPSDALAPHKDNQWAR